MIALGWHVLYILGGLLGLAIAAYVAVWAIVYATMALGVAGVVIAGIVGGVGATAVYFARHCWRIPWWVFNFPIDCVLYLTGRRADAPKIIGRMGYGNQWNRPGPRMAVVYDFYLWVLMAFGLGFVIVLAERLLVYGHT